MTTIKSFIKKYPVTIYFALTFIITWGCMVVMIGPGRFPISAEQFETMGPLVYVGMFVGPSAAGLLMTGLVDGKAGFRNLRSRLLKWRVNIRWYAIALLTAPILATVVLLILSIFSPEFLPTVVTSDDKPALLLTGMIVGLMVGIFEELGWTGFAIPRMRLRYGILPTGIIVGLLWGAWHFLPFWESDSFAGAFPLALLIGRLFSWLPPFRVLMVWVYDRTESLLVVILMHASLTASMLIFPPAELTGMPLLTWLVVYAATLWGIAMIVNRTVETKLTNQGGEN